MADVFVSYSRRDGAFVRKVVDGLQERGKDVWVDIEGIRDAEEFPPALRRAVEESDGFLFVITPASVDSPFCELEIAHALELNKRVVPLLRAHVPDERIPQGVRERNWIPFEDDHAFDTGLQRVVDALDRDLGWAHEHTRWLLKALEWEHEARDRSFLLHGSELSAAEAWLDSAAGKDPAPTPLQREYVAASRAATTTRLRRLVVASAAVAAVAVALLVFALISRSQAIDERTTAKARALAAESQNQLTVDPVLSILLAREAVKTKDLAEARFALRGALDGSPLRTILPKQPQQDCRRAPGIAFLPDGRVAESTCDGMLRLGQARIAVGQQAGGLASHGATLAVGTGDGVALVTGGKVARTLAGGGAPFTVAFSPDGTRLAAASGTAVQVWDTAGGRGRRLMHADEDVFSSAVFSADGKLLIVAAGSDYEGLPSGVHVVDARTGKRRRVLPDSSRAGAVALSPDGTRLAVARRTRTGDGEVTLWDAKTWVKLGTVARFPFLQASALAFSPDGRRLAVGGAGGSAALYDAAGGTQLLGLPGHTAFINAVAFDAGGDRVATASSDGSARVWRARGPEATALDAGSATTAIALDGDRLTAVSTDGRILSWDGGRPRPAFAVEAASAVNLSDGGDVVAGGGEHGTELFRDGKRVRVLAREEYAYPVVESSGARVGVFGLEAEPQVFRVAGGPPVTLQGALPPCRSWRTGQFSPDHRLIAAGTFCGDVIVWDAQTGKRVSEFKNRGQIAQIAFVQDDLVAASWDGSVTLWDWRARKELRSLTGHTRGASAVAASPDGSLIATTSLDGTARVWDPATGRPLRVLQLPAAAAGVAFSTDGRRLVTADATRTLRIWDACPACRDGAALLQESGRRTVRALTASERATYM